MDGMEHLIGEPTVVIGIQFEGLCFLKGGGLIEDEKYCSSNNTGKTSYWLSICPCENPPQSG